MRYLTMLRLVHSIERANKDITYYELQLEWARKGYWDLGRGEYERIEFEKLKRDCIKRFKTRIKVAKDSVQYDSLCLAKMLFGPGYLE